MSTRSSIRLGGGELVERDYEAVTGVYADYKVITVEGLESWIGVRRLLGYLS